MLALYGFSPLGRLLAYRGCQCARKFRVFDWTDSCLRLRRLMLRIQRTTDGTTTVLTVSGRLGAENIDELRQSLDIVPDGDAVALDLADLLLADREAVRFLGDREASGRIVLRHCPAYIRRWLESRSIHRDRQ
jgi:hypothetical protein